MLESLDVEKFLPPAVAGLIMRKGRDALAAGQLKVADIGLLDHLLFRARQPGRDRVQTSLSSMARNLGMRRQGVVNSIRRLEAVAILRKIKDRLWVLWKGIWLNQQATNVYVFNVAPPESKRRTVFQESKKERLCPYQKTGVLVPRKPADSKWNADIEAMLARLAAAAGFTLPETPT